MGAGGGGGCWGFMSDQIFLGAFLCFVFSKLSANFLHSISLSFLRVVFLFAPVPSIFACACGLKAFVLNVACFSYLTSVCLELRFSGLRIHGVLALSCLKGRIA